jgi:hypothetical protein
MGKVALILFLLFFIVLPGALIYLFFKIILKRAAKRKETSWRGKIIDKRSEEYEDEDSSIPDFVYTLYVETEEGKKVNINVPKKIYDSFKVGDKIEKKQGELQPKKIK